MKIKIIILGMLLSLSYVYSISKSLNGNDIAVLSSNVSATSPRITEIGNITNESFVVYWSSAVIYGQTASYDLKYTVTVTLNGILVDRATTTGHSVAFTGLGPNRTYRVELETFFVSYGNDYVVIPKQSAEVTTSNKPIPESLTVQTNYSQYTPSNIVLTARNQIILAPGFHYEATNGFCLKTVLLPQTKSGFSENEGCFKINPEIFSGVYVENFNRAIDKDALEDFVIIKSDGNLIIGYRYNGSSTVVPLGNYTVSNLITGQEVKKGVLTDFETNVNISNLKSGIYVVIISNERVKKTHKFSIK